jgi:ABC-type uncharacterized transport system ATPase subunit
LASSTSDIERLRQIESVTDVQLLEDDSSVINESDNQTFKRWQLSLKENSDPQSILQYCFSNNMALRSFEQKSRSLHDVFVTLVGKVEADRKEEMRAKSEVQNQENVA